MYFAYVPSFIRSFIHGMALAWHGIATRHETDSRKFMSSHEIYEHEHENEHEHEQDRADLKSPSSSSSRYTY